MHQGKIEDITFTSRALGRRMVVRMIVPPDYSTDCSYPVLYFLHPWGLSPRYITDKLKIHEHLWAGVADGTLPACVVALPTGERSFYINAADPPGYDWSHVLEANAEFFQNALDQYGRYGDYLLEDVIPYVEQQYAVRTDRAGRAIGGISMGGAAAAVHAFRDPARFCAVGLHSPALFFGPPDDGGPPWIFGVDRDSFAARNPADLAAQLHAATQPRIYLDTGTGDVMRDRVEFLHQALVRAGIQHAFTIDPGGHDKTYWEPHMRSYLAFYTQGWY